MMHLIGMIAPSKGSIYYGNENLWGSNASNQRLLLNKTGVLFQSGAFIKLNDIG
jgi:phospholipid/cholesterol/gamma-HCH transport system ATP-binding protein